jgi:hypothetical protein
LQRPTEHGAADRFADGHTRDSKSRHHHAAIPKPRNLLVQRHQGKKGVDSLLDRLSVIAKRVFLSKRACA